MSVFENAVQEFCKDKKISKEDFFKEFPTLKDV